MSGGCLSEVDLFRAYREEMPAAEASAALYHVLQCALCNDQWKRFQLDDRMASGIRSAVLGDVRGADDAPGISAAMDLPERLTIPGFKLEDDYQDGGQARVYRAVHEASQEEVAIKVFYNSPLNEGGYARFSAELRSLARLRHPHVIPIRSAGETHGHAYYVMPWIAGTSLDEQVRSMKLTPAQRVDLIIKVASAVDHAHKRGVLHLDLKPSNVRVDQFGEPLVMDFGLARFAGGDRPAQSGADIGVAGTPAYMAPEQVSEPGDVDTRTDVYMLGLLLFEALTGCRARQASIDAGVQGFDLARTAPPPIRTIAPRVPRDLAAIVARATATNPGARYASAAALLDDLRHHRYNEPVRAMGDSLFYRLRMLSRRQLAVIAVVAACFVLLFAAVLITREGERMAQETYDRVSQFSDARFWASERANAKLYRELANAYERLGEHERAEVCALRAETTFKRTAIEGEVLPLEAEVTRADTGTNGQEIPTNGGP